MLAQCRPSLWVARTYERGKEMLVTEHGQDLTARALRASTLLMIWLPGLRANVEIMQLRAAPLPLLTLDGALWAWADTLPVGADTMLSHYHLSCAWATTPTASQPYLCLATHPVNLDLDPDSWTDYLAWSWTRLITMDLPVDHCTVSLPLSALLPHLAPGLPWFAEQLAHAAPLRWHGQ